MDKLDNHIQTFRINSEIKREAQKIAFSQRRKLNEWIRLLIEEKCEECKSKNLLN